MSLTALKDLFARRRAQATGIWRLGQEPQRTIFLEAGDVVFATSTHPQDRLTHLLVERGRITQAQLDYALANLDPGMSIGKNLIQMGFITQRDLLEVARAQVERVVWAALADETHEPAFEARGELDATTVRLPFDTPVMLLAAVLGLRNREALLEELGPLNQVVVLEGRRLQELALPTDLSRLPGLLDGTRTLLELSRESGVEPFRLGAFALFLREIGWARLHELPPLDRRALEMALEPSQTDLSPALPEPPPEPAPSLFSEIHASQLPTTNLEHLSEALDQLGPEDELPETVPLPPDPEPPLAAPLDSQTAPERPLPIQHEAYGSTELPEPPAPPEPLASPRSRVWLLLIPLLALAGWGSFRMWRRHRPVAGMPTRQAPPAVAPQLPAAPAPQAHVAPSAVPPPPAPAPAIQPPPQPAAQPLPPPPPSKPVGPASRAERLKAITAGHWSLALAQGEAQKRAIHGTWTLRLEIACQGATVQHAADLLAGRNPDLFLLPMTLRDGRTCYQVFLGSYASEAHALRAARRLPAPFHTEGNRPKPFRVAEIPLRQ